MKIVLDPRMVIYSFVHIQYTVETVYKTKHVDCRLSGHLVGLWPNKSNFFTHA
jgi:hypothetical protein